MMIPFSLLDIPYKFVWMSRMGYKEMRSITEEAYWLEQYGEDEDDG